MPQPTTNNLEGWEERFDEKFVDKLKPTSGDGDKWPGEEGIEYIDTLKEDINPNDIIQFISDLLKKREDEYDKAIDILFEKNQSDLKDIRKKDKEELIEMLPKIKRDAYAEAEKEFMLIGYNQCLQEVKQLIEDYYAK